MTSWVSDHLRAILSGGAVLGAGIYIVKKLTDKVIDTLFPWLERLRTGWRLLTDFPTVYHEEMPMHAHAFVVRPPLVTDLGRTDCVEFLSAWKDGTKGPHPFLIISGERGVGKTRCCIEFAKNANHNQRPFVMRLPAVRWIHIKADKTKSASEYCAALAPFIRKGTVYVYDTSRDAHCEGFLEQIAAVVFSNQAKLLVISHDPEGPANKLGRTARILDITPAPMDRDALADLAQRRAGTDRCEIDDVTIDTIWRIANGLPGVAVLAVDRVANRGRLEGIETLDALYDSIFADLETQLKPDWPTIEPLVGKMALFRGISPTTITDYLIAINRAMSAGGLVATNGYVRIEPDILSDWMANKAFFKHGKPRLEFDLVLDEAVNTRAVQVLTTLIRLGKRDEAARLLRKATGRDPRTVVELGVLACEGFKDFDFVEGTLGRFWEQVDAIDDPDLRNRVASVLATLGKVTEAHVCWAKAVELYEAGHNSWGVTQAHANSAAMYLRLNNWAEADHLYRRALQAVAQVPGQLGQWGTARLHNSLGLVHANLGAWEKAFQEQGVAQGIYEQMAPDPGRQGIGETQLILGSYYTRLGDLAQAQTLYESAAQSLEKARDWSGLARAYSQLSLTCEDKGDSKRARDLDRKALTLLTQLGDSRAVSEIYKNFANLYLRKGNYQESLRCYTLARERVERLGDAVGVAEVDMLRGWVYERQGDRERAVKQFQSSAAVFARLGDGRSHAYCELGFGNVYYNRGDRDAAHRHYEIADAEFRRVQDEHGQALAAVNLGALCQDTGLWPEATVYYDTALEIFNRVHDRLGVAATRLRIGRRHQFGDGDLAEALRLYRSALATTEEMGAFRESQEAYTDIASVYLAQSRADEALQSYTTALNGFQRLGCRREEAMTLLRISAIHRTRDELAAAGELCKSALEIGKELENVDVIAQATSELARLRERQADWVTAARLFEEALSIFNKIDAPLAAAEASRDLGWIHYRRGNLEATVKCCDEAEKRFARAQYRAGLATVYALRAEVAGEKGDFEQAFESYGRAETIVTELSDLSSLAGLYNNKALAKRKAGQLEEAISLCKQSLQLALKLDDKRLESYAETNLGMCYRDQQDWEKASEHFEVGIEIKSKLLDDYGLAYSDAEVGIMDRQRDRLDEAEAGLTKAFKAFLDLGAEGDVRRVAQEIHQLANRFRARGDDGRAHRLEKVSASV